MRFIDLYIPKILNMYYSYKNRKTSVNISMKGEQERLEEIAGMTHVKVQSAG